MSDIDRLRWRCRRGMRELDVLLTRYLEHQYPLAEREEQLCFQRLLDAADPDLIAWLLGRAEAPDDALREMVARICAPH